jgi:hypothetical protein
MIGEAVHRRSMEFRRKVADAFIATRKQLIDWVDCSGSTLYKPAGLSMHSPIVSL